MSSALSNLTSRLATRLGIDGDSNELLGILKATAFRSENPASDAQLVALLVVADQYGLNPWTKEIYAFPDKKNGIVPVVGVDGWSRIINSNIQFDGMEFRQSEEMVQMPGAKSEAPAWIECSIFRKDRSRPIVIREYLDETYREPFKGQYGAVIGPWQTHPKRFLRHKAMIQCSRIAFGYTGIYDQDEAERIIDMGSADVVGDERAASDISMPKSKSASKPAPRTLPEDIPHEQVPPVQHQRQEEPAAARQQSDAQQQRSEPKQSAKQAAKDSGPVANLTEGMLRVIRAKISTGGKAEEDVLKQFGVDRLEDIPAPQANDVLKFIEGK